MEDKNRFYTLIRYTLAGSNNAGRCRCRVGILIKHLSLRKWRIDLLRYKTKSWVNANLHLSTVMPVRVPMDQGQNWSAPATTVTLALVILEFTLISAMRDVLQQGWHTRDQVSLKGFPWFALRHKHIREVKNTYRVRAWQEAFSARRFLIWIASKRRHGL